MAEAPQDTELKDEQKKILAEAYLYSDEGEYTEAELATARSMFDTPDKFRILRKIFQVLTAAERGLTMKTPESLIEADPADHARYAFESAVAIRADERIRQSLVAFYRLMRIHKQDDMKAGFVKQNAEEAEEKKRTEAHEEREAAAGRTLGPNV